MPTPILFRRPARAARSCQTDRVGASIGRRSEAKLGPQFRPHINGTRRSGAGRPLCVNRKKTMSTILERMREGAMCKESGNRCRSVEARSGCDCAAAADEIEALQMEKEFNASQYRAEIERLTAENERLRSRNEALVESLRAHRCLVDNRATVGECQQCGCIDGLLISGDTQQLTPHPNPPATESHEKSDKV